MCGNNSSTHDHHCTSVEALNTSVWTLSEYLPHLAVVYVTLAVGYLMPYAINGLTKPPAAILYN